MTADRTSALDEILNGADDPCCTLYNTDEVYFDLETRQAARAELAALRAERDGYRRIAKELRDGHAEAECRDDILTIRLSISRRAARDAVIGADAVLRALCDQAFNEARAALRKEIP